MLATAKQAGSIASVPRQQTELPNQSSDWQSMLADSNASAFVYWRMARNESMEVVHATDGIDAFFRKRSSELAEVAIRTGQSQACVLASPKTAVIIAALIPAADQDCLCVRFDCQSNELNEHSIEKRREIVARTAAAIATSAPPLSHPEAPPVNLPSWTELAKLMKKKIVVSLTQRKSAWKVYVSTLLAFMIVSLLPWPHSIRCNVVCEPVLRRFVAAPFDARLLRSHVVVGQRVQQGELLATLDGGDLRSQIASIRAKLAQAEQRELAALSAGDHSKSGIERLEVEHLRREAELLERRQANLEIRSPINGVVVTGDLERAEGAPLSVGDNLFEIASLDHLIAEVAIAEQDIQLVRNGMPVSIVPDAIPGSRLESTIQRIHLRNEIRDNASVFIAEAEMSNGDNSLRPGMNAKATIDAGYRAIGWQLFRRPFNALRQWIGW